MHTSLVYRFEYFDSRTRLWTRSEAFATPDAILRWHGVALVSTAQEVEPSRLDGLGVFIDGPPPPAAFVSALLEPRR